MMKRILFTLLAMFTASDAYAAYGYNNYDCWNGGSQLFANVTTGNLNTACGNDVFQKLSTGDFNTGFGNRLARSLTTGSSNILIGNNGDVPSATTSNYLWIGSTASTPAISGNMVANGTLKFMGETTVATDINYTTATLANVTGLTATVEAAKKYRFTAILPVTASTGGGHKYAIGGTATATSVWYEVKSLCNQSSLYVITNRKTALASGEGENASTCTNLFTEIHGYIVVNAAGTLTVQFAQNAASGTSTVIAGASFVVRETN